MANIQERGEKGVDRVDSFWVRVLQSFIICIIPIMTVLTISEIQSIREHKRFLKRYRGHK